MPFVIKHLSISGAQREAALNGFLILNGSWIIFTMDGNLIYCERCIKFNYQFDDKYLMTIETCELDCAYVETALSDFDLLDTRLSSDINIEASFFIACKLIERKLSRDLPWKLSSFVEI